MSNTNPRPLEELIQQIFGERRPPDPPASTTSSQTTNTNMNISILNEHDTPTTGHNALTLSGILHLVNRVYPDEKHVKKTVTLPTGTTLEDCFQDYQIRERTKMSLRSSTFPLNFLYVENVEEEVRGEVGEN